MDRILVNEVEIAPAAVAAEMQYHPAPSREGAWLAAATALVIRQLLLQEAKSQGVVAEEQAGEEASAEEATIQALLEREIATPEPDEATCQDWVVRWRITKGIALSNGKAVPRTRRSRRST